MPKSMTSSPRLRAAAFNSPVMLNTYGGRRLIRGNCSTGNTPTLSDTKIQNVTGRLRHQQIAMKLHLTGTAGRNLFSGYGPGYVVVNGQRYERSIIVLSERILEWEIERFDQLSPSLFELLAALPIDVLILGTGDALRFPAPACLLSLTRAGIGIEVMDTPAACRTYNFLLSEDRRVAAAVLV